MSSCVALVANDLPCEVVIPVLMLIGRRPLRPPFVDAEAAVEVPFLQLILETVIDWPCPRSVSREMGLRLVDHGKKPFGEVDRKG